MISEKLKQNLATLEAYYTAVVWSNIQHIVKEVTLSIIFNIWPQFLSIWGRFGAKKAKNGELSGSFWKKTAVDLQLHCSEALFLKCANCLQKEDSLLNYK